nr:hypothetical protein [Wadden Sea poxvirus]
MKPYISKYLNNKMDKQNKKMYKIDAQNKNNVPPSSDEIEKFGQSLYIKKYNKMKKEHILINNYPLIISNNSKK